jgi:hypothetical protein
MMYNHYFKKVVSYSVVAILLISLLVVKINPLFSRWNALGITQPKGIKGDLYSFTYLSQFKEYDYVQQCKMSPPIHNAGDVLENTHLYLIGDSFTIDIDTNQYIAGKTTSIRVGVNSKEISLDSTKKNILVIENIERGILDRFDNSNYESTFLGKSGYYLKEKTKQKTVLNLKKPSLLKEFGGEDTDLRLEHIAFDYEFFNLIKECKAYMNLKLFDKVNGNHIVSKDAKKIFYLSEATPLPYKTSSFYPLKESEIKQYVHNAETVSQFYKKMGFDDVYFVFVPNKVSILAPNHGKYNHQIERIQTNQSPKFKTIDLYSDLQQHPDYYHLGDGHWNHKGMELFVKKVNKLLKKDALSGSYTYSRQD